MSNQAIHVVAAAIIQSGKVLIAKRNVKQHQGNKWEFPGGKVEKNEQPFEALKRELKEELDIDHIAGRPLIQLRYQYPDKLIFLDVWAVHAFDGNPKGMEGQPIQWVSIMDLKNYTFPEANAPIIDALMLPSLLRITSPGALPSSIVFPHDGFTLIRQPGLESHAYREYVAAIEANISQLLLTSTPEHVEQVGAAGLHLNSSRLMSTSSRRLAKGKWLSAAVHSVEELEQAHRVDVDFVLVSPVKPTSSHPGAACLGWPRFDEIVQQANVPVYALGGLSPADLSDAWQYGAQGVAGISQF